MNIPQHADREELLRSIHELEAKNHRLEEQLETVTNELNAANEELNQTNEELLATNEELQAINEELIESQQELLDRNTRLERSNVELVEARLLLHATFNQSPLPMIIASLPDRKVLHYNRETRVLFGIVDEPDFTGKEIDQISRSWQFSDEHGTVLEPDSFPMACVLRGESVNDVEYVVRRRDGSSRHVIAKGNRILNGVGDPVAALLTFADITERKQHEQSLKMLRHALDNTNQIVLRFDNRGYVHYANREAVRLLKGTLVNGNVVELFPGIHPDKWRHILDLLPSEQYYHIHSIEQETTSGQQFLSFYLNHFEYANEEFNLLFARDITNEVNARRELARSEERFRLMAESIRDGLTIIEYGTVSFVNQRLSEITGYSQRELMTMTGIDLAAEDERERLRSILVEIHEKGTPLHELSFWIMTKAGERRFINNRYSMYANNPGRRYVITTDMTDWKLAGEELARSEQKFKDLVENTSDWIWEIDKDGVISYSSPATKTLLGYDEKEITGRKPFELMSGPGRARVEKELGDAFKLRIPVYALDCEVMTIDGDQRIFEISGVPVYNQDEEFAGYRGVARDITSRKQSERELRESEEKFRVLAESVQVGILIYQHDNWVYANPAAEHICGYSEAELQSMRFWDFVHPDFQEIVRTRGQKRQSGEQAPTNYEFKIVSKTGEERWVLLSGGSVMFHGLPSGLITVQDITSMKVAFQQVQASQQRLQQTLDMLPIAVYETDADFRVIMANPAGQRMFALPDNIAANPVAVASMITDEQRNLAMAGLQDFAGKPRYLHGEFMARALDGREFPAEIHALPIVNERGALEGIRGIIIDLSEKKLFEAEQMKTNKLESLGILAGGIAHDFNNFLGAILGNISLMRMHGENDDEIQELATEAERACDRARNLTRQLLTFSRGGAPIKAQGHLDTIVRDSVNFILRGSNVYGEYDFADDLWLINADSGQISQVIQNLAINAREAMPGGGALRFEARNVDIDINDVPLLDPGKYVRLAVRDAGAGIAADHLEKIFDPYYTTKQNGSGLGLSISYSIIRRHGGVLTVSSAEGEGATFTLYLPASFEKPGAVKAPDCADTKKVRVLFMDDEESLRLIVQKIFQRCGSEADAAKDGETAINMYVQAMREGKPYDAVIFDLTIPGGMGGAEALQQILAHDPNVKAVMTTGYSETIDAGEYKQYGFVEAMLKPFDILELVQTVSRICS